MLDRVGRAETDVPAPRFGVDIPTTCAESGTRFEFECYDEQERLEAWIMGEVERGAALPGLYAPNADNKVRYEAACRQR